MGKPLIEAGVAARIPVGRAGNGDEIAQVVLLLLSNGYITGQTIAINGSTLSPAEGRRGAPSTADPQHLCAIPGCT